MAEHGSRIWLERQASGSCRGVGSILGKCVNWDKIPHAFCNFRIEASGIVNTLHDCGGHVKPSPTLIYIPFPFILYLLIYLFGDPTNPLQLWEEFKEHFTKDYCVRLHNKDGQCQNCESYAMRDIEDDYGHGPYGHTSTGIILWSMVNCKC